MKGDKLKIYIYIYMKFDIVSKMGRGIKYGGSATGLGDVRDFKIL